MSNSLFKLYNETELISLIANQLEENVHLDYKHGAALAKTDPSKKEISKDVASFANSDGGIIIYGIREGQDDQSKHIPIEITPIDRTVISKEWLEQVITSTISPIINGLKITTIQLNSDMNHVVYVVEIPKTVTGHQSKDYKYYRRHNFITVPLEDFEVRDLMFRQVLPDLSIDFEITEIHASGYHTIKFFLENRSIKVGRDILVSIEPMSNTIVNRSISRFLKNNPINNPLRKIFFTDKIDIVYKDLLTELGSLVFNTKTNKVPFEFKITIYCDNVGVKEEFCRGIIEGYKFTKLTT